ncbi:hypothetical protein THAOC_20306, partial [Thalassiosira oceanica]
SDDDSEPPAAASRAAGGGEAAAPARSSGRLQGRGRRRPRAEHELPRRPGKGSARRAGALGPGDSAGARITTLRTSGRRKTRKEARQDRTRGIRGPSSSG